MREVSRGRFERGFTLPEGLRTEELKARFDKGVLEVSVPLPAEVQPRRIEIEAPATHQIKAA
ncbi:MAG: Hsp20 family protein [Acidobacteria bacterium]|nr:Hsp20 family protein [Acidobacteriota bacterium]